MNGFDDFGWGHSRHAFSELDEMEIIRVRYQLANDPIHGYHDVSRMSDATVLREAMELVRQGFWSMERDSFGQVSVRPQPPWKTARDTRAGTAGITVAAAEPPSTARDEPARARSEPEQRYPLAVALAYKHPRVDTHTVITPRCKLENEFTGPETRRSGEIKPTDPAFSDLRRRELLEGSYTLAWTRPPLDARVLKARVKKS